MFREKSFFDDSRLNFLSVVLVLHQLYEITIFVFMRRDSFLKAMLLHNGVFGAFPLQKFLIEVKLNGFGIESE